MSITGILIAAACVGIVGIFVGLFLGVAGIKFKVEVDEKEEAVLAALPGNNCGGCGFAGCSGLAAAIAKGEAAVNTCPVGGEEVGKKIAAIMGVEAEASERKVAYVHCQGDCERTTTDYDYYGIKGLSYDELCARRRTEILQQWLPGIRNLCTGLSLRCHSCRERCGCSR